MLDYWGGACSVTGITVKELLRASHCKPWSTCTNDQDRLNVFNGFLLCAHLDALFDKGLMTFASDGKAIFAAKLDAVTLNSLNLRQSLHLRWITDEHQTFLAHHRNDIFHQ